MSNYRLWVRLIVVSITLCWGIGQSSVPSLAVVQSPQRNNTTIAEKAMKRITPAQRQEAAKRFKAARAAARKVALQKQADGLLTAPSAMEMPVPVGEVPHYFGPYPNYANSPLPSGAVTSITVEDGGSGYTAPAVAIEDVYGMGAGATATATVVAGVITEITLTNGGSGYYSPIVFIDDATGEDAEATAKIGGVLTGGIRKFLDSLPGLNIAGINNLNQYIPVAIPDTDLYPGCDYYEIELGQYTEQLHTDLSPTTLRGYRQTNTADANVSQFHYLGPLIIAKRDVPVRIKFTNNLPTGADGDLFLPVDTTVMGAGMGPLDMPGMPGMKEMYTQNRATLHLHGGFVPWISDGTPHQWTTPANENTQYPRGVSVQNVPDMPDPGDGSLTFYYNNQQSARLQFYHDHAYGITRLNVYAGEAAGYLITDQVEADLINGTNNSGVNPGLVQVLPDVGIPLIIQDKTFVDVNTIGYQDPTWRWGSMPGMPMDGDLWLPSVYMPGQNPEDLSGANAFGRWQYGPWFWPPTTGITHPPVPNPYYQPDPNLPNYAPWEPSVMPNMPSPSMGMEAYMDTPLVNGTVYPFMEVDPKAYRFRILNAANDRFFNLHFYVADPAVTTIDGRINTEVKMVPAVQTPGYPATWSIDGREGGVPDPTTAGPAWIQIGTEGGFLPAPTVINNQPINWNMNATAFNVGNVSDHSLLLGCAERADVVVDFTPYAGKTLILYNDAPAAFPALDPRYDYYTGNPDLTDSGGAPTTQPGYGPNTRTIMQIRVSGTPSAAPLPTNYYNPAILSNLQSAFAKTDTKSGVFEVSQDPIIVPQQVYNSAYNLNLPFSVVRDYVRIFESSKTFTPMGSATPVTIPFQPKAIQDEMGESYDVEYGRMGGFLGLERPSTNNITQNFMLYGYASPPVDILQDSMTPLGTLGDGTQIWKITHNGVDTHPIHFHLVNVQLINRVAWDGALMPPDPNEIGWKDTVRVNPLEDTIVAMRPVAPTQPFDVPNSIRLIDPTMPEGAPLMSPPGGFIDPDANPIVTNGVEGLMLNHYVNFGWEYVWHCHILSHEEMDMMHSLAFAVAPNAPTDLIANESGAGTDKKVDLFWTDNSHNETNFTIQRAGDVNFTSDLTTIALVGENVTTYTDPIGDTNQAFFYRVCASNVVGDTTVFAEPSVGFPVKSADSAFTNTAQSGEIIIPAAPTSLTAAINVPKQVTLSWTDNATNESGFVIERSTNGGAFVQIAAPGSNANTGTVSITDTTVVAKMTYSYRIKAVRGPVSSAYTNTATITLAAVPAAPSNLTASANTPERVTLTWMDNATNESGFIIQRSTNGGAFVQIATPGKRSRTGSVSYTDTNVVPNTNYSYRVAAASTGGISAFTNTVSVRTLNLLGTPPTNLTAAISAPRQVTLTWTDNSTSETGFVIERSANGGAFVQIAAPGPRANTGTVTYTDTTVLAKTTYSYRVKAVNGAFSTAYTNTATVTLAAVPAAPSNLTAVANSSLQVTLTWMDNATNESGFIIQRSTNGGAFVQIAAPGKRSRTGSFSYIDNSTAPNTSYRYRVAAVSTGGTSAFSNTANVTTP